MNNAAKTEATETVACIPVVAAVVATLKDIADVHVDDGDSAHITDYAPDSSEYSGTEPGSPWAEECERLLLEIRAALPAGWTADWSDDDVVIERSERLEAPRMATESQMAYVRDSDNRVVRVLGEVENGSTHEVELARSAPAGCSLVALECEAVVGDTVHVTSGGVATRVVA